MKAPAFQFYVRDWLLSRAVARMSGEEVKAYVYLLCESWLEDPRASLPNDDDELARMAQVSTEKWLRVKGRVMANFVLNDNRWVNEKLLGVSNNQSKFKNWGKLGGNPHLVKKHENEPKEVNPIVNPIVNGSLNPLVNLATATATASKTSKEEEKQITIKASNSPKRKFTDLWSSKYQETFKEPYMFQGAKDGKAADSLLSLNMEPENVIEIAVRAWMNNGGFWSKQAHSLSGFASKFNEIRGELGMLKAEAKPESINESWNKKFKEFEVKKQKEL